MKRINKTILKDASQFYNQVKFEGQLQQVTKEIQELLDGIHNKSSFRQLLHLENCSFEKKRNLIEAEDFELSSSTQEYIRPYLTQSGLVNLVDALEAFVDIYNSSKLEIKTAVPLTEQEIEQIASAFQKKTNQEYDSLVNIVDPDLIGGVLVKCQDYLLDGTIAKQLSSFGSLVKQTDMKR